LLSFEFLAIPHGALEFVVLAMHVAELPCQAEVVEHITVVT